MPVSDPRAWSVDDVAAFLAELELVEYIPQIRTEKIDGSTLLEWPPKRSLLCQRPLTHLRTC